MSSHFFIGPNSHTAATFYETPRTGVTVVAIEDGWLADLLNTVSAMENIPMEFIPRTTSIEGNHSTGSSTVPVRDAQVCIVAEKDPVLVGQSRQSSSSILELTSSVKFVLRYPYKHLLTPDMVRGIERHMDRAPFLNDAFPVSQSPPAAFGGKRNPTLRNVVCGTSLTAAWYTVVGRVHSVTFCCRPTIGNDLVSLELELVRGHDISHLLDLLHFFGGVQQKQLGERAQCLAKLCLPVT